MTKAKTKTPRTHTRNHVKRRGLHHKKNQGYVKTYAPYLPLIISIVASIFLSMWQPHGGTTLAYATNTSIAGLLQSTNAQRAANARAALTNNAQLNQAAQAKANDMVKRDYWSHDTPDGKEPWVFITAAGYQYSKAGENLAYGFTTSSETVTGWMNSATHRANLLDAGYTQVGFGFANSQNFNGDGKQTVVVAMYGYPLSSAVADARNRRTPSTQTPTTSGTSTPTPQKTVTPEPAEPEQQIVPITTGTIGGSSPPTQQISRIDSLTGGNAPWALGAVVAGTIGIVILMLVRHSLKLRHLIRDIRHGTEKFILHHPLLDSTLLGLLLLGIVLSQTKGFIL